MRYKLHFLFWIVLTISTGCAAEPANLMPHATEIYMEASIMDKPAFISHTTWDGRNLVVEMEGSFIIGSRESHITNRTKAVINSDGRPQEIEYENEQPGATTRTIGKLQADKLLLETTTPDGKREQNELLCPSGTILSEMSDIVAGPQLAQGKAELKLTVLDLDQLKVAVEVYKVINRSDAGFTVSFSREDMALLNLTMQFDKDGQPISAENTALRLKIKRITATEANNRQTPTLNIESLTYVDYKGQMANHARKSVIRLALSNTNISSSVVVDAPGQTAITNPDGSVTVTITAMYPPKDDNLQDLPEGVKAYLASTSMVPWSDQKLIDAATSIAPTDATPWTVARLATAWVGARLGKDRPERGMLTAKEALERGCGDCTEHAVLLAALLRARGIPSRLAAGVAYIGGRFGFHMWTLAWIGGAWIPLDATFGYAPIPADRITMALVGPDDRVENVAAALLPALGKLEITVEHSE